MLYGQPVVGTMGVGPELPLLGRGASYSNVIFPSVQAGYFVSPNWSLEVAGGIPVWQTVRITGYSAVPPYDGTVLTRTLPGAVEITGAYHFTQFGAFQPYLGAGLAPIFSFAERDGFSTGGWFDPSIALVLQGGADYMINRNWGLFFDAKKLFDHSKGHASGIDLGSPVGVIPAAASIRSNAQPWVLSTGVTFRF